jgi:hypothetical protein
VLETAGLNTTELGGYCRERGLYPEQVDRWRKAAQDANAQPLLTMSDQKDLQKRHQEGLDLCGQYPVPPLETGDLPGRHRRSPDRALAAWHPRWGPGALAVCPCHRCGAHPAGGARHCGAGCAAGGAPDAAGGGESGAYLRQPRRAGGALHPVFRDDGSPLALSRGMAGRVPLARAFVPGSRAVLRSTHQRRGTPTPRSRGLGALSRGGGLGRIPQPCG